MAPMMRLPEKRMAGENLRPNFDKTPNWSELTERRTAGDHAPAIGKKLVFRATDLVVWQHGRRNAAYRIGFHLPRQYLPRQSTGWEHR
jgi:hypothetical protein